MYQGGDEDESQGALNECSHPNIPGYGICPAA
jgi:hypothetical protein